MATSSSSAIAKSPAPKFLASQTDKAAKIPVPNPLGRLRMPVAQQTKPGSDRIAGRHAGQASVGSGQEDEVSHDYSDTFSRPLAPQGRIPSFGLAAADAKESFRDYLFAFFGGAVGKNGNGLID